MQDNVTLAGIKEHHNKNCKSSVENFLQSTLGIIKEMREYRQLTNKGQQYKG